MLKLIGPLEPAMIQRLEKLAFLCDSYNEKMILEYLYEILNEIIGEKYCKSDINIILMKLKRINRDHNDLDEKKLMKRI